MSTILVLTDVFLQNPQTVRRLYGVNLQKQAELAEVKIKCQKRKLEDMDLDRQIKKKTLRKLELEIKKTRERSR